MQRYEFCTAMLKATSSGISANSLPCKNIDAEIYINRTITQLRLVDETLFLDHINNFQEYRLRVKLFLFQSKLLSCH